jgi:hypothetical protein
VNATRRTVIGWLLASVLVRPSLDEDTWYPFAIHVPVAPSDLKAVYMGEEGGFLVPPKFGVEIINAMINRNGVIRLART